VRVCRRTWQHSAALFFLQRMAVWRACPAPAASVYARLLK
jgi:hypothetical protein